MASKASNRIICGPAEERGRLVIENNEKSIVELMDPDRISRLLMNKGIIDISDRRQILLRPGLSEKNRILIGKLLTRGHSSFKNFMESLYESGTDNHLKLARILRNNDPIPSTLSEDQKLVDSKQKRMSDKIKDHEQRLKTLEEEMPNAKSEEDVESIREELMWTKTELDELKQKLKTRDGELQEAREENRVLQKRIQSLEKKIESLETTLRAQKSKIDSMSEQQQQDEKRIESLEGKLDMTEKNMDEKLQDQEERHTKEMEEIKQMIREQAKKSHNIKTNTPPQTKNKQKTTIIPRHRFQDDK